MDSVRQKQILLAAAIAVVLITWLLPWLLLRKRSPTTRHVTASLNLILCGGVSGAWLRFLYQLADSNIGHVNPDSAGLFNIYGPVLTSSLVATAINHFAAHALLALVFLVVAWWLREPRKEAKVHRCDAHMVVSVTGGLLAISSMFLFAQLLRTGAQGSLGAVLEFLVQLSWIIWGLTAFSFLLFIVATALAIYQGRIRA